MNRDCAAKHMQRRNMAGFRAAKLDTVRVGVLGMGRGDNHIKALVQIEGVEIRAICDSDPREIEKSKVWFKDTDHNPEIYTDGDDVWMRLCEQSDLDLIFVCTPIPWHARMSIYAMRQGKHVDRATLNEHRKLLGHWVEATGDSEGRKYLEAARFTQ